MLIYQEMSTELRQSTGIPKKTPLQLITNQVVITNKNLLTIPKADDSNNHYLPSSASRADSKTDLEESLTKDMSAMNDVLVIPNQKAQDTERNLENEKERATISSHGNTEYEATNEEGVSPIKLIARKNSKPLPYTAIKKLGKQIFTFCHPTEDTEADDEARKNSGHNFSIGMIRTESTLPEVKKEDDNGMSLKRAVSINK